MTRRQIDGGGWFDAAAATAYEESTYFDGHNMVSHATGSQWAHELLYRTRGGTWILHAWSQWQGSGPGSMERIGEAQAYAWLIRHGHEEAVPADVVAAAEA